jgi:demethoxyubiquinone hydroxylase (CLK1/Coq7/Cat5 family)
MDLDTAERLYVDTVAARDAKREALLQAAREAIEEQISKEYDQQIERTRDALMRLEAILRDEL